MTQEVLHSVELAANTLAIACEPLRQMETRKAEIALGMARILAVGITDVLRSLEGTEESALADTMDVLEELLNEETDDDSD